MGLYNEYVVNEFRLQVEVEDDARRRGQGLGICPACYCRSQRAGACENPLCRWVEREPGRNMMMTMPNRITDLWLAENVPGMGDDDYQTLLATMVERGWKLDGDARAALRALRRCQPPA